MSNSNYIAGRKVEYEIAKEFRESGYEVIRAAGSHGKFDLVGIIPTGPVLLIQCKRTKDDADAIRLLKNFKRTPPMAPADKKEMGVTRYVQVMIVKVKGGKRYEEWVN